MKLKSLLATLTLSSVLLLAACGNGDGSTSKGNDADASGDLDAHLDTGLPVEVACGLHHAERRRQRGAGPSSCPSTS